MLLQFKRQQKDDHKALCKTNDTPDDARQRFLQNLGSQLDFVTAAGGPVCNAIAKERPICNESIDDTCTTHTSCFVKVFPDKSNGNVLSACFCPSSTGRSKCQDQELEAAASSSQEQNSTRSAAASSSSTTNTTDSTTSEDQDNTLSSDSSSSLATASAMSSDPVNLTQSTAPATVGSSNSSATIGSSLPPNTTIHPSALGHPTPIAAILGAIIGGLLFLLLIGVFLYFRRRKRKSHIPPSAEFLERGYGARTPQPALFDGQRDSAAELLPDYDRGTAANPPFEKESEVIVASPEGYGVGHGLSKRQ